MEISIIAAVSKNDVIGHKGTIPWDIPEDLKRFRGLTLNKPVVMGRKTWESMPKALDSRNNIVMSTKDYYNLIGARLANSALHALSYCMEEKELCVIGGEQIYRAFLPITTKMYLTRVHATLDGDAFFPKYDTKDWRVVKKEWTPMYTFLNLVRK